MKKRIVATAAVVLSLAVLLTVGMTSAFLTDVDVKDNVITIGRVGISLDEGGFDPEEAHPVVPGSRIVKAPKLTNEGNKDELVFMKITVPKAEVTLLHETDEGGAVKGTPRAEKQAQELFRFLAEDSELAVGTVEGGFDCDFSYHVGSDETDGWVLLGSDTTDDEANVYMFGYNRRLEPTRETVTLFDAVQLKSFLDAETSGEKVIGVNCYGIQADNLKPVEEVDLTQPYLGQEALQAVYAIVANKLGE